MRCIHATAQHIVKKGKKSKSQSKRTAVGMQQCSATRDRRSGHIGLMQAECTLSECHAHNQGVGVGLGMGMGMRRMSCSAAETTLTCPTDEQCENSILTRFAVPVGEWDADRCAETNKQRIE